MEFFKKTIRYFFVVLFTAGALFLFQIGANIIPVTAPTGDLRGNILKSLSDERLADKDWDIIQVAWNVESGTPIDSTLTPTITRSAENFTATVEKTEVSLDKYLSPNIASGWRYGLAGIVRAALFFTPTSTIYLVLLGLAIVLVFGLFLDIAFRKNEKHSAILMLLLMYSSFLACTYTCAQSIYRLPVIILMCIGAMLVLACKDADNYGQIFLIMGIMTAFFDISGAGLLTLTIPAILMVRTAPHHKRAVKNIAPIVSAVFWWVVGYVCIAAFDFKRGFKLPEHENGNAVVEAFRRIMTERDSRFVLIVGLTAATCVLFIIFQITFLGGKPDWYRMSGYITFAALPAIFALALNDFCMANLADICPIFTSTFLGLFLAAEDVTRHRRTKTAKVPKNEPVSEMETSLAAHSMQAHETVFFPEEEDESEES